MVARGQLTDDLAAEVDVEAILWLLSTDVGQRLRAGGVKREVAVYFSRPSDGTAAADCMDHVMVRGRLDAIVPDGDRWMIVDYKTDRVTGNGIDGRVAVYAEQVKLYAEAVAGITGRTVSRSALVFLHAREIRWVG